MEDFVVILLIIGLIMLIAGLLMVALTVRFVKREEHPILSIFFAILSCPCIYIPIHFTIGFVIARCVLVISLVYSTIIVIVSVKNIKKTRISKSTFF